MNIKQFQLGVYGTNCYLVWNENKETSLFDCGGTNLEGLYSFLEKNQLTLKNLILTHGHGDHVAGVNKIKEEYKDLKVYIGKEEEIFLTDSRYNLSTSIDGKEFIYKGEYTLLEEGDTIFGFEVIDTPGHTAGSKCYYNPQENILISGDTMFRRSHGRCDLPTGNYETIRQSLRKLCEELKENTVVYTAHTEPTTIGEEKIFLKSQGII